MGQNNNHLKFFASKDNLNLLQCVKWNMPNFNLPEGASLDILFSMSANTFNGETSAQLMISDIHSDLLKKDEEQFDIKILDHRQKINILPQVLDFISSTKKSTAIYLQNMNLRKELSLPDDVQNMFFNLSCIPVETEQIMFFDIPPTKQEFIKIIAETNSKIIHLMNFNSQYIATDSIISKLSGMLKYALSNLKGVIELNRISSALNINYETLDIALSLFENCNMIDLDRKSDEEFIIKHLNPVELSKIKQDDFYLVLDDKITEINSFRKFYLSSDVSDIKKELS